MDIFDRNPHPFGLVRTGVAPDHPEMKKLENDYEEVLRENADRVNFFGNVWVGKYANRDRITDGNTYDVKEDSKEEG